MLCRFLGLRPRPRWGAYDAPQILTRGLRVEHFCYPTRTRSTGPLPVPVPDPYSKFRPDPTRTRGYTRTRQVGLPMHSLCSYKANRLATRHVVTLINIRMMIMMMEYVYTNSAKKEETRKRKGRSSRREGKMKSSSLSKL